MATRVGIMDAARIVFGRKGLTRSTLLDVANEARVTRGAIYWHFKNKEDLFNAMMSEVRLPMEALLSSDAIEPGMRDDPLGQLRAWCRLAFTDVLEKPAIRELIEIMVFKCELVDSGTPGSVSARKLECFHDVRQKLIAVMQRAVDAKQVPADLNVQLAAVMLQGTVYGTLTQWLFAPDVYDLAAHYENIIEHCLSGLQWSASLRVAQT